MVYELGHVDDRFKNKNKNNIGRCGSDNVNKFIGNIAKNYMETTEGENWASNLITHLNTRFPTSVDNPKNFIQQEVQDVNLHQIISLPDLLVSNSSFPPQNDMNLGYSRYSPAAVNIYNPIFCGGSTYNEYIQNGAYGGMPLISPLGVKQSDLDIITSPEQASTITACSYGDIISDTEAFDSLTAISSFRQQPFHNSQYISAYNMDHPLLSVDDVQSPYSNPCNVQQSFHNLPEASDAYGFKVLSAYVMYKGMPANLREEVSFQDYMHAAECQGNLCKCHLHLKLASHFDKCNDLDCSVCGPARSLCGSAGSFQLDSRKRKLDQSEATDNTGPTTTGTLLDVLPTKYPKLESSKVGEDAMDDEKRGAVDGAHDQDELTVVNQNDNVANNEMMNYPKLDSSKVREGAMDDEQRKKVNGAHDQQQSTVVNHSDDVANNDAMKYPKSDSSTVGEDAMEDDQSDNVVNNEMMNHPKTESSAVREDALDDEQRREVNGAHDQQESTVVSQGDTVANNEMLKYPKSDGSEVGEDATNDDQEVISAHDQQQSAVVDHSDNIVNNEMLKYPKSDSSAVVEDAMDDEQRREVDDAHDKQALTVVSQSDNVAVHFEMMNYPKSDSSAVVEDAMDDEQRREVDGAHDQQDLTVVSQSNNVVVNSEMKNYSKLDSSAVAEDALDDEQRKGVNGARGQQESTVLNQSDQIADSEMLKYPKLDSTVVEEDAMDDDKRREVNDQQEPTVVDQSDNIADNEILKYPKLNSSNVGEDAMGDDQTGEVNGTHNQQELTVVCQSNDNVVNNEMVNFPKSDGSTVEEDAMDVDQRREVNSVHDQQESIVVNQSDYNAAINEMIKYPKSDSSTIGEDAIGDEQKRPVNGAHDQLESTVVKQTHNIANNWMLKYPILESSTVREDDMDDRQRRKVNRARDQKKSTVVKQSGNILNNETMNSPQLSSDHLSLKDMITDEKEKSGEAIVEANNDPHSGAEVADLKSDKPDLKSDKPMTPDVSMVDCDPATKIKIASLTDNAMVKSPRLCSDHDHLSSKEMIIDEKEKSGQAIIEANTDSGSGADVADLTSNKSMTPDVSVVNCDSVLESDHTKIKVSSLTVNEMIKSPQLFSYHHSSKEMIIDEKEKSGADVVDLNSNKSMKPNVSMVDCDPVLESDNTKIKTATLTDNDSQLEPEKIKIQSVSLADFFTADQIKDHLLSFTSQKASSENRAPSIGPNTCHLCSNDKLVFAPTPIYCSSCETRIKRKVGYYRTTSEIGTRHCFCISCYRGTHGNNILMRGYGYSMPKSNLQKARNDEEKEDSWVLCDKCQNWQHRICGLYNDEKDVEGKAEYICPKCYLQELESGIRVPLPQSTASGAKDLPRTNLSDHIEQRLFERLNQERQEMAKVSGIKPSEVPMAEGLVVRVVVSVEKHLEVRQKFRNILHGEDYPSGFTYRSKLIFLFQKIEGVDVCLFGMCVQEFGSECGGPNNRCVYISYLDSVRYFRPERKCVTGESLRTFVYHEILTGYLDYCKKRGFTTCYIWACPLVKGEDYIFYCHPETQRTPKQDKLRQWYKSMLKKATEADVVVDHTNLYNQFFVPGGEGNNMKITAARLPYFDGDYWSVAAENYIRKLELEDTGGGGLQSKLPNKRVLKAMGQDKADIAVKDVLVMHKLAQTILYVKENFMIVHLQHICTHCREVILSGSRWFCSHCNKIQLCSRCFNADKSISETKLHTCHSGEKNQLSEVVVNDVTLDTKDTDDVFVNSFFETRDAFLNKCQKSHFQFDTLSRAKYSSMMILYHLIYKPVTKPTCTACHSDVVAEQCFYCDTCPKYYICELCYRVRHGAYHPHTLYPPSLDIDCGSKSIQLQMQRDWQFKIVMNTLMHASDCDRIPCAYKECNTIRRLFSHAVRCSVKPRADCKFCRRVWLILRLHSQICTDSDCKIPRCMDIKKHRGMLPAGPANEHVTMNVD